MTSILDAIKGNTEGSYETRPFCQAERGSEGEGAGIFITDLQATAVGFGKSVEVTETSGWVRHRKMFNGAKDITEGWLAEKPRMIILLSSPLAMFQRETGKYIGVYDDMKYKANSSIYVLKTKYLVFFVNNENKILHETPLQLTAKGVFGGSFGDVVKKFKKQFLAVTGEKKRMNSVFWSRCILQPHVISETKKVSGTSVTMAKVTGFTPVKLTQLERVYLSEHTNSEDVEIITEALELNSEFGWNAEQETPQGDVVAENFPEASPFTPTDNLADRIRAEMAANSEDETDEPAELPF